MAEQLHKIEDSEYLSARRIAGLARLAIHHEFEVAMVKVDQGRMSRENAAAHIAAIRPGILKSFGVIEGFDDAAL